MRKLTHHGKTIDTLVEDIQSLLVNKVDNSEGEFDDVFREFGESCAAVLKQRLSKQEDRAPGLRMSSIGRPCARQTFYDINNPENAEPLTASTIFKFLYGDLIEEILLSLSTLAGHRVEGRQDELDIAGVKGHRDAVIDGVTVDVKSASFQSFNKFRNGKLKDDDPFGYITQIQSYSYAAKDDPIVTDKDRVAFLVADKSLGHICLDIHEVDKTLDLVTEYEMKKAMVEQPNPPPKAFNSVPDGESGNRKLSMNCSYCQHKFTCWPGVRTFLYSGAPRYLTTVVRQPASHIKEVSSIAQKKN